MKGGRAYNHPENKLRAPLEMLADPGLHPPQHRDSTRAYSASVPGNQLG